MSSFICTHPLQSVWQIKRCFHFECFLFPLCHHLSKSTFIHILLWLKFFKVFKWTSLAVSWSLLADSLSGKCSELVKGRVSNLHDFSAQLDSTALAPETKNKMSGEDSSQTNKWQQTLHHPEMAYPTFKGGMGGAKLLLSTGFILVIGGFLLLKSGKFT